MLRSTTTGTKSRSSLRPRPPTITGASPVRSLGFRTSVTTHYESGALSIRSIVTSNPYAFELTDRHLGRLGRGDRLPAAYFFVGSSDEK
jgi:hypothetical protein